MALALPTAPRLVRVVAVIALLLCIATCTDLPTAARGPAPPTAPTVPVPAVTGEAVVLVGAGQNARCDQGFDEATAQLLDGIAGTVFTTGDIVHASGSLSDFEDCYGPSWGRHLARTRPAPGDLEYRIEGAAGYFSYFGAAAGDPETGGYYSYDLGAWHIVVLNSNIDMTASSPQVQWLIEDLANTAQPCVLAYWHHPRFSSYSTAVRGAVKPFWDALYAAQADVVLNGHYRLYERFAPQTPAGAADPERGIRQFTVGTGGHGVNSFGSPRPNSEVRKSGTYGVLKLTLESTSYSWDFVPIASQTFTDTGAGTCHGRPGGSPPNQRPTAAITEPVSGTLYQGGDVITYSGSASDPEDGTVPPERLTWWADFHHDTHTHPFLPVTTGSEGGTVTIPTVGEISSNVWYRFYLVATDAEGRADTVFRDVQPRTATLTVTTEPAGLQVTLDGQPHSTPLTVTGVVGIDREIGAVSPQTVDGTTYEFASWSDDGSDTHTISTPSSDASYTATYTATSTNAPPTVGLTAPPNGGSAEVNTSVTVGADAGDPDGTVTLVEFFDGAHSIGTDATSPYSITWTPTVAGQRTLTARATDDLEAVTMSDPVSFTVTTPQGSDTEAPTTTLTAPADESTGLMGSVTVTATATDNVGVAGVEFQIDGEPLGAEDTTAPYAATLPATSAYTTGLHVFRARSRDTAGNRSPWSVATVTFGGSVNLPAGFSRTTYTSGLSAVTAMAFAPDGRLFICEQNGQLRVVPAGSGAPLATPFHTFAVTNSGEQGLLGIAFHPNFASNGWVYVYYTSPTPSNHNRVSRVVASAENPDVSTGVETILLDDLPSVGAGGNHNGGALHFSPIDGKLYLAIGDQGHSSNAPSMTSRFGKLLRYNDDLSIPTDNPFYGTATGVYRAIWALGLRNPFTFAFHPTTGRLFINDVGQNSWEEINEGVAGSNYGWPTTEGYTSDPRFRGPIFAYEHGGTLLSGYAVVGAAFYAPATRTFPVAYVGDYFFADYASGWINRLDPANGNAVYAFARTGNDVFDLHVGPDGALYALARGTTFLVYRYQFQ
jgi:glucose/arabinose dehydrogenase